VHGVPDNCLRTEVLADHGRGVHYRPNDCICAKHGAHVVQCVLECSNSLLRSDANHRLVQRETKAELIKFFFAPDNLVRYMGGREITERLCRAFTAWP